MSATTRAPRPGEVDGEHYYFISDDEFDRMVRDGEFLEYATVHNAYRYGTPRPPVDAALASGRSVLLEIDLQGARAVRRAMPEALLVFLLPPLAAALVPLSTSSTHAENSVQWWETTNMDPDRHRFAIQTQSAPRRAGPRRAREYQ